MTGEKLSKVVEQSGLKKNFIAEKLGISYQGYLNKEKGKTDFTSKEISIMRDLLHLSNKEVMEIFLS